MKTLFSNKAINLINKIEFIVIFIIAYSRIMLIGSSKKIEESGFFVCFIDVEYGWTFILLTILLIVNFTLLFKGKNPFFWILKVIVYLSLLLIIDSFYWFTWGIVFVLFVYYLLNPASIKFKIQGKKKILYILFVLIGTVISVFMESIIDLTNYY